MKNDRFAITAATTFSWPSNPSMPIKNAIDMLSRDFAKVFGSPPSIAGADANVVISLDPTMGGAPESYSIAFDPLGGTMRIIGNDELAVVFALLHVSGRYLGVDPFWYWADKEPVRKDLIEIEPKEFQSPIRRVRFRGWFVNDEVCLIGWTETYPPPREVWSRVFETLLRLGGNIVIPGTDLPRDGSHFQVASDMGLYLTHHHAEPFGAEMFFRVYPDSDASFDRNPELFTGLWEEAIERQRDRKTLWALGFRGQGDCPFWENDPSFDTDESRGSLISQAIQYQHDLLKSKLPDAPSLTYLYGEIAELYRGGHIKIPEGVTKIWSDNGYGRMVTRRQNNHNLRIPSLPLTGDTGPHGMYYHATFHDLQASSHLTMLPVSPDLLISEVETAFASGVDHVMLVNCGNIRPHIFTLGFLADLWNGNDDETDEAEVRFARKYFTAEPLEAAACLVAHLDAAPAYGPNDDDRAGDEFYHHPARLIIGHTMRGNTDDTLEALHWVTGDIGFENQVACIERLSSQAASNYADALKRSSALSHRLEGEQKTFFDDFLGFQNRFLESSARGQRDLCLSISEHLNGRHPKAFVLASRSLWAYEASLESMTDAEHGKWAHFFRADWLTNVRITMYAVQSLRTFYRMHGDNPDFFLWHKEFLMPDTEKRIYLENTHRNPPADDDLARRLQTHFGL